MKRRHLLLALLPALAACDSRTVEVEFAAPFPAGAADLSGFPTRDQGRYCSQELAGDTLLVTGPQLLLRHWPRYTVRGHGLDSLGVPRRAGVFPVRGEARWVLPLAADSFRVSWPETDTLLTLATGHLRRYRGWYYLSKPAFYDRRNWQVERLAINGPTLRWQTLRNDTLRLRALEAGTVQVQREQELTQYTLRLHSARAVRQLHRYAGLWTEPADHYLCPR